MKRAAIYCRVSTDEQAEKGYSLESQRDACERYAEEHGFRFADPIMDDYSGAKLNRPGLELIRDLIARKEIDAIVVYSSDRWTRNLAHSLILREELLKADIELHYVNRGKIEDTPENRMMSNIEGVFDEYWREKIIESCKRGRNKKAKTNHPVLTGNVPYGYRKSGKGDSAQLVIYEEEANIVNLIFNWYIFGENGSGPLSLKGITDKLNRMGIPVPASKKIRAKCWHTFTVHFILTNELYIGRTYYGKLRVINGERIKQPREKWIAIDVPHLGFIAPEIFGMVQKRAQRNSEIAKRHRNWDYLLSGHFKCGHCGYTVNGSTKNDRNPPRQYYRCGSYARYHLHCDISHNNVRVEAIDKAVWDWLVDLISDDTALKEGLDAMVKQKESEIEPQRIRLASIDVLVNRIDGKMRRLMDLLGDEEDVIAAMRADELRRFAKEKDALIKEYQTIEFDLRSNEITVEDQEQILEYARAIRKKLVVPTFEEKRRLLDALDVRAKLFIDGNNTMIGVKCRVPRLKSNLQVLYLDDQEFELIALSPSKNSEFPPRARSDQFSGDLRYTPGCPCEGIPGRFPRSVPRLRR